MKPSSPMVMSVAVNTLGLVMRSALVTITDKPTRGVTSKPKALGHCHMDKRVRRAYVDQCHQPCTTKQHGQDHGIDCANSHQGVEGDAQISKGVARSSSSPSSSRRKTPVVEHLWSFMYCSW